MCSFLANKLITIIINDFLGINADDFFLGTNEIITVFQPVYTMAAQQK